MPRSASGVGINYGPSVSSTEGGPRSLFMRPANVLSWLRQLSKTATGFHGHFVTKRPLETVKMFNEAHDCPPGDMDGIIIGLRAGLWYRTVRDIVPAASVRSHNITYRLTYGCSCRCSLRTTRLPLTSCSRCDLYSFAPARSGFWD